MQPFQELIENLQAAEARLAGRPEIVRQKQMGARELLRDRAIVETSRMLSNRPGHECAHLQLYFTRTNQEREYDINL